jgi:hypothetical protein
LFDFGKPGLTKSHRLSTGRYHGQLTNLPPRLQEEAQAILWRHDPEASIIFELPLEPNFRASCVNAAMTTRSMVTAIRTSCDVEEPIYYCLVASPAIQGCSFLLSGDARCIAIWMGALIIGRGLLNRLIVMPALARHFGLSPRPDAALKPLEGMDTFAAFQMLREPNAFAAHDEHERDVVAHLSSKFGAFLVAHEVAHVLNGHLFLSSKTSSREMMELENFEDLPRQEQWTAHALEWDADMFAGIRLLGGSLLTKQAFERHYSFKSTEQRLRFRLINTMLAIYVACRLFQRRKFDLDKVLLERHPPGAMRLLMLMTQAYSAWTQIPESANVKFPGSLVLGTIGMCEEAIAELTGIEEANFNLLNALPPDWVSPYQKGLFAEWKRIQPELSKWKIGSHHMVPPDEVSELPPEKLFGGS